MQKYLMFEWRLFPIVASMLVVGCNDPVVPTNKHENTQSLNFDVYPARGLVEPVASGATGLLTYDNSCMFLINGGSKTGLVLPDDFQFDGSTLSNEYRKIAIGETVTLTGRLIDRTDDYQCKTPQLLLVDNAYAAGQ